MCFFFFKQKTSYEMRISDWSSDVCSSDLAKAVSSDPCGLRLRMNVLDPVESGGGIGQFADAVVEAALAAADTAKVEPQHGKAAIGKGLVKPDRKSVV